MHKITHLLTKVLQSSEMACSLRYEDIHGCPYNVFSAKDIMTMALICSFLAFISLIVGA